MNRAVIIAAAIAATVAGAAMASQNTGRTAFDSPLLLMSPSVTPEPAEEMDTPSRPKAERRVRDRAEFDTDRRHLALLGLLLARAKNAQLH